MPYLEPGASRLNGISLRIFTAQRRVSLLLFSTQSLTVMHGHRHVTARRVSLTLTHALTPIVKTRSHVLCTLHSWSDSRVPAAAPICHLRVRPHALSLTSCFISLSARSDEAMRLNPHAPSGSAEIQPPRRGMSVLHVREHDAPTTARNPPAKLRTHCAPQKKEPRTPPYPR